MLLQMNVELLKQKADMIEEYFCIHIDKDGNLSRLPVILDQYTPDMDRVPEFVLCLGNDVSFFNFICYEDFPIFITVLVCVVILTPYTLEDNNNTHF